MDITPFIRELILLNECVILRGIGGFETSYRHALYRKDKKILTPPSKKIRFQPEWIRDNGVLENYIAKSMGISNDLASDYIDNYVQNFHNKIHAEGKVILEGIGEFIVDKKEGRIEFTEFEDTNYLAESFGLDILNVEQKEERREESASARLTPINSEPRKLTGWYIALGILLLVISVTFIILLSEGGEIRLFNFNNAAHDRDEVVVFGSADSNKSDSVSRSIEEALDNRTSVKSALNIETNPSPQRKTEILAESGNAKVIYYLVAGSFKNSRNAEILQEQLIRKGFSPEILQIGNLQFRVIIGTYYDRRKAIEELRRIRIQLDQSVWLYEFEQN